MRSIQSIAMSAAAAALLLSGCGASQTEPYHPVEGEFDEEASDERAVELIDAMLAELGGADAWNEVKQLRWDEYVFMNDELQGLIRHAWDRWNARHRFEQPVLETMAAAEAEDDPSLVQSTVAMYKIYDQKRAHVMFAGQPVDDPDAEEIVEAARERFDTAHFLLAGLYRLKEPGMTLSYGGESEPMEGYCEPSCAIVMVRLAEELGGGSHLIHINTETSQPEILARQTGAGQQAYALAEWTEVNGIQFPVELRNLGNSAERVEFAEVEIGDVEKALYVPTATRQTGRSR